MTGDKAPQSTATKRFIGKFALLVYMLCDMFLARTVLAQYQHRSSGWWLQGAHVS